MFFFKYTVLEKPVNADACILALILATLTKSDQIQPTQPISFKDDGYYYNPCDDYLELSEETRAAGYNKLTSQSDNNLGLDWYRFTGDAGDKMADM